jgi:hypothetical protein
MRLKKIVYELTDEDLVALATSSKEDVVMDKLCDAAKFIYECNIKHGDHPVPAQVIYHTYREWKRRNHCQPKNFFFRDFSRYFPKYRNKHGIHYMLDPKPFDLSDEAYWLIRAEIRRERARRK